MKDETVGKDKTIKFAYETMRESVFTQLRNVTDIDTKISVIIGFNSLVFVLSWQLYPDVQNILFILGIGLLILSLFFLLTAYSKKIWYNSPNPQALVKQLKERKKINEIYWRAIEDIAGKDKNSKSYDETLGIYRVNKKKVSHKNHLLNVSIWILLVALITIGLSRAFSCLSL